MKVLFLTLQKIQDINQHGIYEDLLREFIKEDHEVFIVSPIERRERKKTSLYSQNGCTILRVHTGNIQKTNFIEKGISTILIQSQFINAINSYFEKERFDLVLYSTPPVTFASVVKFIKRRDNAKSFLLLKDILPDAAVDIGVLSRDGIKGIIYRYFKLKEKQLYDISDNIGCMSQANVDYLLSHHPELSCKKVCICPNCIEPEDKSIGDENKCLIRRKYGIPLDKKVFVYGGNLGRPQGIDFLIDCVRSQKNNKDIFFLIVGSGTEYSKLESFVNNERTGNILLMKQLPKEEFDNMVGSCDIGMIFLDSRFIVPNFPSRLLSYMQAKLPVIAMTDKNTDIGKIIENGGFGWWAESSDVSNFEEIVTNANYSNEMKELSYSYLCKNYSTSIGYKIIMEKID